MRFLFSNDVEKPMNTFSIPYNKKFFVYLIRNTSLWNIVYIYRYLYIVSYNIIGTGV